MRIVFASENKGKLNEIKTALSPLHDEIIPQNQFHVSSIEETGKTFIENALLKARHASECTNLPALSDDSGLCINALNGKPGIHSARFAGPTATTNENIEKVLNLLKATPPDKRHAYFYCVLVLITHPDDPTPLIAEGIWHGKILSEPRGKAGFGYDPIFYDEHEKMAAAELSIHRKNEISHRGLALQSLLNKLREKVC